MGKIDCPECGDTFSSNAGMKIHYGKSHEGSISGVESSCDNCGKEFRQKNGNHIDRDRDFCEPDCYYEWMENKTGSDSFSYNRVNVSCSNCGNGLERQPNVVERNERHFCNMDCRAEYQSNSMTGENNPNFNPNYDKEYGENWGKIREFVLERDFYRCRCCRISNDKHKRENGMGLDIHHRTPLHYFDSVDRANKLSNLISLCRRCHSNIESNIITSNDAEQVE